MSILAHFLLACAALSSFGYLHSTQFTKSPGGDAGVGHAFVIYTFFLWFAISMGVIAIVVGAKGGFLWLGSNSIMRFFIALVCFLLILYGLLMMEDPGIGLPRQVRQIGSFLLMSLLLCWSAFHLYDGFHAMLPGYAAKSLTILVFALGMVPVVSQFAKKQMNWIIARSKRGELSSFEEGIVARIDSTDAQKGINDLLVHTAKGRHPIVREKAIAKIKSRPDWQEEMVRLLGTGNGPNVFYFLSSNPVEKMDIFPAAINKGILTQAEMIRESIRNCSHRDHLRKSSFFFEINDLLKSIKPFQQAGYDFTASLQILKDAFNERCDFDKPKFDAVKMIGKAM